LTLCWRSFPWWRREGITICFDYKGGQKFLFDSQELMGSVVTQDTWRNIMDAPLMLHWRSFPSWSRDGVAISFTYPGGQTFHYNWLQPIGGVITEDAQPEIVDTLFTLISRMM
jgi:hypothetical protein